MSIVKFWQRLRGSEQIMVAAAAGFVLFLLWASIARVDEVSRGQGRVIPSSKVQIIQSAEPSTIREILVRSGQTVQKGQLLVRLDNTTSQSELGQLETENARLAQRAARLAGEGSGAGCAGADCGDEARLAEVRRSSLQSQLAALSAGVEQRRRDMGEAQATATSLESSLRLARQQVTMLEPLAAKGVVPQTELLTAQREVVDIQGRLAAARQAISRSQAAVREAGAEVSRARFDFQHDLHDLFARIHITAKRVDEQVVDDAARRGTDLRPRKTPFGAADRFLIHRHLGRELAAFIERLLLEVEARARHFGARFAHRGLRA